MSTQVISTVAEAIDLLDKLTQPDASVPEDIKVVGELAEFKAVIQGKHYHGTVPGELARGLWEYQEAIYRAAAFALYSVDDIRKLNSEQRADFEFIFKVTEGSTEILAALTGVVESLGEAVKSMDSKHKVITIIAVALILTTGYGAVSVLETDPEIKKAEIAAQLDLGKEREKTDQFKILSDLAKANPVVARFSKASEEGTKAIIKSAGDADNIKVGKVTFDRDEIREVNRRATKESASAKILNEDFLIVGAHFREASSTKYLLARKDGTEFSVNVAHEDFDADALQQLHAAAQNRKPISLEVNATIMRDQIKSAQLVKVN